MHRLEHALIVLRDLRRCKSLALAPGNALQPHELETIADIDVAIRALQRAWGRIPPHGIPEKVSIPDNVVSMMVSTEAIRRFSTD